MRNYKAQSTLVRLVAETFLTSSLSKVIQRIKVTYDIDFIHAKYFHLLHKILSFLTNHSPLYFLFSTKKVYQENVVSETFTSTQSLLTQFRRQRLKVQTLQKSQSSGMNGERVSAMQQVLF